MCYGRKPLGRLLRVFSPCQSAPASCYGASCRRSRAPGNSIASTRSTSRGAPDGISGDATPSAHAARPSCELRGRQGAHFNRDDDSGWLRASHGTSQPAESEKGSEDLFDTVDEETWRQWRRWADALPVSVVAGRLRTHCGEIGQIRCPTRGAQSRAPSACRLLPTETAIAWMRRIRIPARPLPSSVLCQPSTSSAFSPSSPRRRFGITVGEALFSDGLTARFRVLCRDPASVRVIADRQLPEHEKAVEAWLTAHSGRAAA